MYQLSATQTMYQTTLMLMLLLALPTTTTTLAEADRVHIGYSPATLLSGDMTSCAAGAVGSDCKRGLASALALFRNLSAAMSPNAETFIPILDKDTAFVQAHPLNVGVNTKVFANFSISNFLVKPWIFTDLQKVNATQYFEVAAPAMLGTNLVLDKSDPMYYYVAGSSTLGSGDHTTTILSALRTDSVYSTLAVPVLKTAVAYIRKSANVIVLLCDDKLKPASEYFNELYPYTPHVVIGLRAASNQACTSVNGSFFCDIAADSAKVLASIVIDTAVVDGKTVVTGVSYTNTDISLSADQKDAKYYEQQAVLLAEANSAIANDPVVGSSTVTMPSGGRTDDTYPCYVGECAQGTLFVRSYLKKYPADFSISTSGGFRGSGWSPGPVKLSHVWAAAPYSNTYCTGRLLGLRVWQLYDLSMRKARFVNTFTETGDRLLQSSGVEVEVNPAIADEEHRLIALRIYNNITGKFEPIERLRYYTFASDNFLCESMADLSPLLQAPLYDGESVTVHSDDIVQVGVADYLKANDPYDNLYSGFLQKVTSTSAMMWSTAQVDCGSSAYWSAGLNSCVSCPSGMESTSAGTCVTKVSEESNAIIYYIAVPVGVALLAGVIGLVVFMEYRRRKNVRNIGNAPRGGDVAIVFTDIQSSTKLWGTVPASMAVALDSHHAIIRAALAEHGGYEVKTVGDCFMMALHTAEDAVSLCVAIQKAMAAAEWPAGINEMYLAPSEEALMEIDDDPARLVVAEGPWNGLRVRMGINFGPTEAVFDEVTKGYDYYGPTVNLAARVESAATGGQILISRDVERALGVQPAWPLQLFCAVELRGVSGKTELLQVHVDGLDRVFTPPMEDETAGPEAPTNTSFSSKSSHATHKSISSVMEKSAVFEMSTRSGVGSEFVTDGQKAVFDTLEACLRVTTPTEKLKLVESLAKSWRVPFDPTDAKKALVTISLRSSKQIERKAVRRSASIVLGDAASPDLNQQTSWYSGVHRNDGQRGMEETPLNNNNNTSSADFSFGKSRNSEASTTLVSFKNLTSDCGDGVAPGLVPRDPNVDSISSPLQQQPTSETTSRFFAGSE